MAKRRNYMPINPHKYNGGYPIVLKSNWEEAFAHEICDLNIDCVEWTYEPWKIPYRDPITGRNTVYVPDFLMTINNGHGRFESVLVEIKPLHEAVLSECRDEKDLLVYMRNEAKWEAARGWCSRRKNIEFVVLSEDKLGMLAGGLISPPKKKRARRRVKKS